MKDRCPRTEELSALVDGELAGAEREDAVRHAGSCPLCGAMLADLGELRIALRPLAQARAGIDLAPLIQERLGSTGRPQGPVRERHRRPGWQILPSGLAAAGVLAAGLYLGTLLAGGAGVAAMRPAAMALFDAVPPGGLCVGLSSCYPLGK